MPEGKIRRDWAAKTHWSIFRVDALLLVFLLAGGSLIFATATLGLRRNVQKWLSVDLMPPASANYGVDIAEASRLAPVQPQIIEAVRQDARTVDTFIASTPVEPLAKATPTSTLGPTPTLAASYVLAVSIGGPYIGNEGSPISLVGEGVSRMPETISYRWDLDDDGLYDDAAGILASVVFYDEGEYTIGIHASDQTGSVATDTTTVSVSNLPPIVSTGGDRYSNEGDEISFSATVSDPGHDVLFYYWDFGDGTEATGTLSPLHTYPDNGNYIVSLRVEDNDGGVTHGSFIAYVGNLPPVADAGPDQATNEGDSISFSGVAADPGIFDTLTYAWDLNYDGLNFTPDVSGPTVSTVYRDGPATIVAALRVRDNDGGQAIDAVNVTVGNVAPIIVSVTNDGPVGEGSALTLVVSATDVGSDTLAYAYDWENDGSFDAVNQLSTIAHTWYNQGSYTVGILADDGDGGQSFITATVSAYNVAPIAVAGPSVARLEGAPVTFDASASSDPGIYDALTYLWNFGDGSPLATGITRTHTYIDNSVYGVTLTVTDDSSATDNDSVAVTIHNANPIAEAGSNQTLNEGEVLNLTGSAGDPGIGDVLTFTWDFNYDGISFDEDATGISANRTYPDGPANYVVAFRARDDDYPYPTGGGGEIGERIDTLQVTVNNLPPIADAGGPYTANIEGQPVALSGSGLDVPADTLTYAWDLDDDSTFDLTGQTVITAWNEAGIYTVTLRVTDDDGGAGFDTARVIVGNVPPTAEAGGPYTGYEGSPIVLTGTGSDLNNDPLTYTWDLDYDTIFETPGQVVTYTWPDDGVYTVTLRVEDGRGGIANDDAVVWVSNTPPTADAGGPYTATLGIPAILVGSGTDVPSDTLTYAWDLDSDSIFEAPGQVVTYTWMSSGTYIVVLQVDDGDGGITTDTTTVDVNSLSPLAWLGVPYYLVLIILLRKRRSRNGSSVDHHQW